MKIFQTLLLLLIAGACAGQVKNKQKEKAPTQKELSAAMKDMQKMMDEAMSEMSPEDRRMMDSLGIRMPDMKNVKIPKATDAQLAAAWEDDSRLVPKRDIQRINAIPKGVTPARLAPYVSAIQASLSAKLDAATLAVGKKLYADIKAKAKTGEEAGTMAAAFWTSGQTELSLYLLGRVCTDYPAMNNNLSNYAAALTMLNGEHLAIPILQNLNAKFPRNSTILNNLGQAWFGLGELDKAANYLDSVTDVYLHHPQANMTIAAIAESKGNVKKAREAVKRSIRHAYTKEKEEKLNKLGEKLLRINLRIPFRPSADPLGLGRTKRPDYPTTVSQIRALLPLWEQFNRECDVLSEKLEKELYDATNRYAKSMNSMATRAMAGVQQAMQDGAAPALVLEPPYARKASLQLSELEAFYSRKMEGQTKLYMDLQNDLAAIRKKRTYPPPEAPCTAHRDALNAYLKAINERQKEYDDQALLLFRHYANDMAYWSQYTSVDPNGFKIIEIKYRLFWLQKNREFQPLEMSDYRDAYVDCADREEARPGKLTEFDDVACNYKASVNFYFMKHEFNCSHSTTTFPIGDHSLTIKQLGMKYIGSTIRIKPEISEEGKMGPLKVEGSLGGDFTIELDENNDIKDWEGTVSAGVEVSGGIKEGGVEATAKVKGEVEMEISGRGIGDVNMIATGEVKAAVAGQNISVGIQDKISLISGHGSISGTGIAKGIVLTKW